jgi:hypothetical protein
MYFVWESDDRHAAVQFRVGEARGDCFCWRHPSQKAWLDDVATRITILDARQLHQKKKLIDEIAATLKVAPRLR